MNKPVLNYVVTLLTGGLFGFYWLFNMAKIVQAPNYRARSRGFLGALILHLSSAFFLMSQVSSATTNKHETVSFISSVLPFWFFTLVIILFYLMLSTLSAVSKRINEVGIDAPKGFKLYLLFALYFIALPILQARLNRALNETT